MVGTRLLLDKNLIQIVATQAKQQSNLRNCKEGINDDRCNDDEIRLGGREILFAIVLKSVGVIFFYVFSHTTEKK